jgi:uncharacterized membrane protein
LLTFRDRALVPLAVGIAVGAVAALLIFPFAPPWWPLMVRIVAVYNAAVIGMLAFDWTVILRSDIAATRTRAASEDPGRNVVTWIVALAIVFGFIAAFDILLPAPNGIARHQAMTLYVLGLLAVALGWLQIQTVFVFRYAHLYYQRRDSANKEGAGLAFPGTKEPKDLDFAYFSFVLGMTFQVSDVQITNPHIRALALLHGLVSFGYNTAILALVVNTVAGLLH